MTAPWWTLRPKDLPARCRTCPAGGGAKPKPVDMASLPALTLRSGAYANFTRLVFDWSKDVPYTVFPGAGKMTVKFQAQARPDLSAISRFQPPWVKNAAWHLEDGATVVEFETDADSGYHDFKDGTKIVLDVLAPKTDAPAAYAPRPVAPPSRHHQDAPPAGIKPASPMPRLPPSPTPPNSFSPHPRQPIPRPPPQKPT